MKNLILSTLMLLGLAFSSIAQEKNAIGIRLGDNDGFGGEVTYQRWVSKANRLEFDLGFRNSGNYNYSNGYYNGKGFEHNAVKLVGLYQWVWDIKNGFKWYAGPGIGVGFWKTDRFYAGNDVYVASDSGAFIVAAGDIGIEYNFDFPLQLSFDFRPELYISDDYDNVRDGNFGPDFGLSARFRF